jgi:hypothetical protein
VGELIRELMLESRHMKEGVFESERLERRVLRFSMKESMCEEGGGGVGDLYTELNMSGLFPRFTWIVSDSKELGMKVDSWGKILKLRCSAI